MSARVIPFEDINASMNAFDINASLTEEELKIMGLIAALPGSKEPRSQEMPVLKDLDEADDEPVDAVEVAVNGTEYNLRYHYYMQYQAIASLAAFKEGWSAFEELVLAQYLRDRKRENDEYRGDDPNKSFALRLKYQSSQDFVKFIQGMIQSAVHAPKPVLK